MSDAEAFTTIKFTVSDGVGHLVLDRPENANALNDVMARELLAVAKTCRDSADVRAVLWSAEGERFCAGGDLAYFASLGEDLPGALQDLLAVFHPAVEIFSTMDAPVITAIQGPAAGAGLAMVAAASYAIASSEAWFSVAYTAAGLTPDGSSSYYLPRLVGLRRAEELMITNRRLTADEALAWGLVNEVVPSDALMTDASAIAARLAAGPTRAFGTCRRLLQHSFDSTLSDQLAREGEAIVAAAGRADGREGIRAFLDKRKPRFTGA